MRRLPESFGFCFNKVTKWYIVPKLKLERVELQGGPGRAMQIADMSIEAPRVGGVAVSRAAVLAGSGRTTLVGLIGTGIQPSRMPALHEREGAAQGLT